MTAEEIRKIEWDEADEATFIILREIAAQLAEINKNLAGRK